MKRRPCCKADPEFGPTCTCGGAKAKQAWTCQACHGRLRGYQTVPLPEQNRRWRLRYIGQFAPVGDEDAALIERAGALAAARAAVEGELAALVAEQAQDERCSHLARDRWMVPLDSLDRYGRPLYEIIAA